MNPERRNFISGSVAGAVALATGLHSHGALAADGYELIDPPQNTSTSDAIEVMEFFWLGCPHCYSLESNLAAWKETAPDYVKMVREAPPLNPSWEEHSRAFYAAKLMGNEDSLVDAMFQAIHAEGQRLRDPDDIADLAVTTGLNRTKFINTMGSFAVQTKLNRSVELAQGAGISSVPTIVINGRYRTTVSLAGSNPGVIEVINQIIAVEKQTLGID